KEITLRDKRDEVARVVRSERYVASRSRANMSFLGVIPRYVLEAGLIGGLVRGAAVGCLPQGTTGALSALALFSVAGYRIVPSLTRFQSVMAQTGASMPYAQQVLGEIRRGASRSVAQARATSRPIPQE